MVLRHFKWQRSTSWNPKNQDGILTNQGKVVAEMSSGLEIVHLGESGGWVWNTTENNECDQMYNLVIKKLQILDWFSALQMFARSVAVTSRLYSGAKLWNVHFSCKNTHFSLFRSWNWVAILEKQKQKQKLIDTIVKLFELMQQYFDLSTTLWCSNTKSSLFI